MTHLHRPKTPACIPEVAAYSVRSLVDWASLVGTGISTGSAYLICRTFAPGSSLGRLSYFPVGPSGCRMFRVSCFIPFLGDPMTTATRFKRCPTSLPAIDIHSLSTRFEGRRPQAGFGEGLRICSHSGSFGGVSKSRHCPTCRERSLRSFNACGRAVDRAIL